MYCLPRRRRTELFICCLGSGLSWFLFFFLSSCIQAARAHLALSNSQTKAYSATMPSALAPEMKIKAVLFDLDGTLLDTEALSDKAITKNFDLPATVLEELKQSGVWLPWEIKQKILGLRATEWVPMVTTYAHKTWGVEYPFSVDEFTAGWESNLNSFCEDIEACRGAQELVEEFSRHRLPMAIATSSRNASVNKKRKRHEKMFQHISTVVCGDDPELEKGKPAPDIYLLAARRLGVDPSECIVFEDAMSGVKAGKAAGCFVVAVPDPRFSSEERAEFSRHADIVLKDLHQFDVSKFCSPPNQLEEETNTSFQ